MLAVMAIAFDGDVAAQANARCALGSYVRFYYLSILLTHICAAYSSFLFTVLFVVHPLFGDSVRSIPIEVLLLLNKHLSCYFFSGNSFFAVFY